VSASADVVDWAVVLGCAAGSPMLASRCARALRLVREGQARKLFLSGTPEEAAAMVALVGAAEVGVEFVVDDAARRTFDNVVHARAFVGDADVWLVTSRFHLPRALFLARRVGLRARGVGDDGPAPRTATVLRERLSWLGAVVDAVRA
jgi:SanA protein